MKKSALTLIFFFLSFSIWSQIGINTENPFFDLDVRGDVFVSGVSKIDGVNTTITMNRSIQLELPNTDRGLRLNTVSLTDPANKQPLPNVVDGTVVFNRNDEYSLLPPPGAYIFRENNWHELLAVLPTQGVSHYYSSANVIGGSADGGDQSKMVSIPFSSTRGGNATSITLPETGSYAFNVKLYSTVCNSSGVDIIPRYEGNVIVYVGIWVNNVLNDVSEIFYRVDNFATGATYISGANLTNVVLGCFGRTGDVIDVRLGVLATSLSSGEYIKSVYSSSKNPNSAATSLLFWRL